MGGKGNGERGANRTGVPFPKVPFLQKAPSPRLKSSWLQEGFSREHLTMIHALREPISGYTRLGLCVTNGAGVCVSVAGSRTDGFIGVRVKGETNQDQQLGGDQSWSWDWERKGGHPRK